MKKIGSERDILIHDVGYISASISSETNVTDRCFAFYKKLVDGGFGCESSLYLTQALASFLRSLNACDANAEIDIDVGERRNDNVHRITINYPDDLGLDVGAGVRSEQDEGDG